MYNKSLERNEKMREVNAKINFEYECFFMNMMHESKEQIYAQSMEIEIKKKITKRVREIGKRIGKETTLKLEALDNILEHAYRFISDYQDESDEGSQIDILFEKWLKSL